MRVFISFNTVFTVGSQYLAFCTVDNFLFCCFVFVLQKYYIKAQGDNKIVRILNDADKVLSQMQSNSLNYGLIMLNLQFKYI